MIITQDLCNVCSVDLALVQKVCKEMQTRPSIISLNPFTVEDVLNDILTGRTAFMIYCNTAESATV